MTGRYDANEPVLFANDTPVEGPSAQLTGMISEAKSMQMELLDQLNSLIYSINGRTGEMPDAQEPKCLMQEAAYMCKITREA